MSDNLVVKCDDLKQSYHQGGLNVDVLQGVNLEVEQGSCIAITGASGSGKSTLLHLLGGLDEPTSGEVVIAGESLSTMSEESRGILRNKALGFVYQFHHLLPEFTALENVAMPLLVRKMDSNEAKSKANNILDKVGLGKRMEHKPGELSGGERQRAAIARALVTEPRCILADEPTGNLDEQTAAQVFDLMIELNQQYSVSLIMVTHNMALAGRMDTVKKLHEGVLMPV